MKVLQGLIIFLAAALIIFVGATVMFAFRCNYLHALRDDENSRIEQLESDNKVLLTEKLQLQIKNDELTDDNIKLTAAIKELRQINKELMNDKAVQDIPPAPVENAAKERLPKGVATNRYDCEGFKFPAGTQQAMLQEECATEWEYWESPMTGLRYFFDGEDFYYCVALGGAYGIDIGDAWRVTLANGSEFNVILADYQHDISDPDPDDFGERYEYDSAGNIVGLLRNYDGEICVHVLEFIADIGRLSPEAKEAGGMHGVEYFGGKYGDGGNIVKIKYLGRKWEP